MLVPKSPQSAVRMLHETTTPSRKGLYQALRHSVENTGSDHSVEQFKHGLASSLISQQSYGAMDNIKDEGAAWSTVLPNVKVLRGSDQ